MLVSCLLFFDTFPLIIIIRGIVIELVANNDMNILFMFFVFSLHPEWIDFPRGDQHLPGGGVIPGNNYSYDKCRRRFDLVSVCLIF